LCLNCCPRLNSDPDKILVNWMMRGNLSGVPGGEQFALRGWDPERYGTLNDPGDDFSFHIYTQAARGIGTAILGGAVARKLVARGASQSALRLRTYANAIQPMERLFDGFLLLIDFGRGALPDTGDVDPAMLPMRTVPLRIRDDLVVPALVFNSETEAPAPTRCASPIRTCSGYGRSQGRAT
jgi:hypothetical protein